MSEEKYRHILFLFRMKISKADVRRIISTCDISLQNKDINGRHQMKNIDICRFFYKKKIIMTEIKRKLSTGVISLQEKIAMTDIRIMISTCVVFKNKFIFLYRIKLHNAMTDVRRISTCVSNVLLVNVSLLTFSNKLFVTISIFHNIKMSSHNFYSNF